MDSQQKTGAATRKVLVFAAISCESRYFSSQTCQSRYFSSQSYEFCTRQCQEWQLPIILFIYNSSIRRKLVNNTSFRYKLENCTSIQRKIVSYARFRCSFGKCANLRKNALRRASLRIRSNEVFSDFDRLHCGRSRNLSLGDLLFNIQLLQFFYR